MGKLSKSDEQLSSLDRDSGQCSRNTSCETLGGLSHLSTLLSLRFLVAALGSYGDASLGPTTLICLFDCKMGLPVSVCPQEVERLDGTTM